MPVLTNSFNPGKNTYLSGIPILNFSLNIFRETLLQMPGLSKNIVHEKIMRKYRQNSILQMVFHVKIRLELNFGLNFNWFSYRKGMV